MIISYKYEFIYLTIFCVAKLIITFFGFIESNFSLFNKKRGILRDGTLRKNLSTERKRRVYLILHFDVITIIVIEKDYFTFHPNTDKKRVLYMAREIHDRQLSSIRM